ncbi:Rdx family protein [Williamsia sterculiae]|uniref:Rdx family protein n=2 Tax=Williamsia sterculiae TaxID=1344003 RepID=A0A1N7GYC2_9NOCA|nr:Rdx family protein [Williamsia sterculiae]
MAAELLNTFGTELGEVALRPGTGGVFVVEVTSADRKESHRVWDRKRDSGFPDIVTLKRLVRDVAAPDRDLGHGEATRIPIRQPHRRGILMTRHHPAARDLLIDAFGRVQELVVDITDGLSRGEATYRPDPEANTIAWLLWHLSRVQDDHVAGLAEAEQAWPQWRDRFALPFDDWATGYAQSAAEVGQVDVEPHLLREYHDAVHTKTLEYLNRVTDEELERVVDDNWDPPVTAGVRLVSVINDADQHLGQAAYVAGMASRAGVS